MEQIQDEKDLGGCALRITRDRRQLKYRQTPNEERLSPRRNVAGAMASHIDETWGFIWRGHGNVGGAKAEAVLKDGQAVEGWQTWCGSTTEKRECWRAI